MNNFLYDNNILRKHLHELRLTTGLNILEFSKKIGLTRQTISKIEDIKIYPKYSPTLQTIMIYCNYFNCDIDFLFNRLDNKTHNIDFICKYTGLNEDSINLLNVLKITNNTDYCNFLNALILQEMPLNEDLSMPLISHLSNLCYSATIQYLALEKDNNTLLSDDLAFYGSMYEINRLLTEFIDKYVKGH